MHIRGHRMGIREQFGSKKQIFSFGGLHCGLSNEDLMGVAAAVIKDIEMGCDYKTAHARANALVNEGPATDV
jgi:hypothetical protein